MASRKVYIVMDVCDDVSVVGVRKSKKRARELVVAALGDEAEDAFAQGYLSWNKGRTSVADDRNVVLYSIVESVLRD